MVSLRSQDTLQKEYNLQADQTVRMNLKLLENPDQGEYQSTLTDCAMFANTIREKAFEGTLVVLQDRPEIKIIGEGDNYSVTLFVNGNCWRFHVNGSTSYELDDAEKVAPGRTLKRIWDLVVESLPENFIIRGVINQETPGLEARSQTLEGLGFGPIQPNSEVYSIKREGVLHPMSLEEFLALTGITPGYLGQNLNVRKITWPGA